MTTTRTVVLAVLLAVCGLAIAPFAGMAVVDGDDQPADTSESEPESEEDRPMGSEVSAFMQSSGANTENAVESETFDTDYDRAENRTDVVGDRVERLEHRLASLETEREELRELKADDEISGVAYDARMSRLAAQINALDQSIDDIENRGVGVDEERLATLREGAKNVSGPEVAATASGLAVVDPPRGPPEETPGQGNPQTPGDGEPQTPDDEKAEDDESQVPERERAGEDKRQTPDRDDTEEDSTHSNTDGSGSDGQQNTGGDTDAGPDNRA